MIDITQYEPENVIDSSVGFESYNNVELALDNVPEQFKGKPAVEGLLATYVGGVQALENLLSEIFIKSEVDNAVGDGLDQLGNLFGERREGRTDLDYRYAIKARIAVITSKGTPDIILSIAKLISNAKHVNIHEHYPASFSISMNLDRDPESSNSIVDVRPTISDSLKSAAPIGVGYVTSLIYLDDNAFFGELNILRETLTVQSDGTPYDLVNEDGDLIETAEVLKGSGFGGFGILSEIIPLDGGLESGGVLNDWVVVSYYGTDNLLLVATNEPSQVGIGESGVLAEVIINGD